MPTLVVRRSGSAPLSSVFTAVYEPFERERFLDEVQPVAVTPASPDVCAMRVTHGEYTDTIVVTHDQPPYPERLTADGVSLQGRVGVVRRRGETVVGTWLFEGTDLRCGGNAISSEAGAFTGDITAAPRIGEGAECDGFITDAKLPAGETLQGAWVIVTHGNGFTHGYPIERIDAVDGMTRIVLGMDHGLHVEGSTTREVYVPRRTMEGANRFRIPLAASAIAVE
jgi:hypothetical protein